MDKMAIAIKILLDFFTLTVSDLFDADWYVKNNSDLIDAHINPVWHYLRFGGFEGRAPSTLFDSAWYLQKNEDVRRAGINPLLHYVKYGRREGRCIRSVADNPVFLGGEKAQYVLGAPARVENTGDMLQPKVFCIGVNKTGTTSLGRALQDLGYRLGDQRAAVNLLDDWKSRKFEKIIPYCETADAFQDIPFSLDFTYQALDYVFPNAKFILTLRNNSDEWFRSLVRFHQKLIGINHVPTADDVKAFFHESPGRLWHYQKAIYGINERTLYDEDIYKANYENHNLQVMEYFRFRPNDLLIINLADDNAIKKLCDFLDVEYTGQTMPHLNQSS